MTYTVIEELYYHLRSVHRDTERGRGQLGASRFRLSPQKAIQVKFSQNEAWKKVLRRVLLAPTELEIL